MTALMTVLAAAGALSAPAATRGPDRPAALVVDAQLGRDGRELVAPALRDAGVTLRLPRTAREARVDVRYLVASGHDVTVVGPQSIAAAGAGVHTAADVPAALSTLRRAAR